jgi:fatty-acyl-CoA synthase
MEWYRKRTLGGILDEAAQRWGQREALVFGSRRWTYAELSTETDHVARALMALGVEPGENVALWLTNRPEWLFVMFAVARIGACLVPLNTRYRTDDVAYTLRQSRSGTLITLDRSGPVDYQGMLMETMPAPARRGDGTLAIDAYPDLRRVVVLGKPRLDHARDWSAFGGRAASARRRSRLPKAAVDPDGRMVIRYTSGTTGHPRARCIRIARSAIPTSGRRCSA